MPQARSEILLTDPQTGSTVQIVPRGFHCMRFRAIVGHAPFEILDFPEEAADTGETPVPLGETPVPPGERAVSLQATTAWRHAGIPVLFPFPNRIRGGRFEFDGRTYQLPPADGRGNAIHGFVRDFDWEIAGQGSDHARGAWATGRFHASRLVPDLAARWPADFVLEMTYALLGNTLACEVRVTNPGPPSPHPSPPRGRGQAEGNAGPGRLPFGFGTHPYFRLPLRGDRDPARCRVQVPAAQTWELVDYIPTGRVLHVPPHADLRAGKPLEGLRLDDVLTGLEFDGDWCAAHLTDHDCGVRVTQRWDRWFREVVVYTPPAQRAVCIEPYTCATDAVNLAARGIDAGWRTLAPGETTSGRFLIEVTAAQQPSRSA